MSGIDTSAEEGGTYSFRQRFWTMLGCFLLLTAVSIPTLLSFDLWIWKDRSCFLNLDYLMADHYRLGVDVSYSYGLLPVLLQHLAFAIFGRGYKPMLGITLCVLVITAWFWALLLEHLPQQRKWLFCVAALTPILLWVNPNFPYSIAVLGILFALLFVLKKRLDLALASSAVGSLAVPSLPLVLMALLTVCIFVEWLTNRNKRISQLVRQLAPGVILYAVLSGVLALFFGIKSVAATALPIAGAKFYQTSGYGKFTAIVAFLHPCCRDWKYYAAYYASTPVTWFCICTVLLAYFAARAVLEMVRLRRLTYPGTVVILCFLLQFTFITVAYGSRAQHSIYEPVLALGTLLGVSLLPFPKARRNALILVVGVGMLGESAMVYKTALSWKITKRAPDTLGLYSDPGFAAEWSEILHESNGHRVLVLSYATGVHNYYPQVDSPPVWFLLPGLLGPSDLQRIDEAIQHADFVVADLTGSAAIVEYEPGVKGLLDQMRLTSSTQNFRVWRRNIRAAPTH